MSRRAASGLIGHTGFVGGNLAAQHPFDAFFNTKNIDDIRGQHFELLVCAGARAEKWKANADPQADLAGIQRLLDALAATRADRLVLISTVDVFARPIGVDEDAPVVLDGLHAYGRHRRLIETTLAERFDTVIVRLPGLYGPGLKKNILYDFLNDHETHKIDSRGSFQFYGVDRLWDDLSIALRNNRSLVHLATAPVTVAEITRSAFGREFFNEVVSEPATYDVRTKHDQAFGGAGGYIESRDQVLQGIRRFVERSRDEASR